MIGLSRLFVRHATLSQVYSAAAHTKVLSPTGATTPQVKLTREGWGGPVTIVLQREASPGGWETVATSVDAGGVSLDRQGVPMPASILSTARSETVALRAIVTPSVATRTRISA